MSLPLQPTLDELRQRVLRRLGYGAQGASSPITAVIEDYLREAQDDLWTRMGTPTMRLRTTFTTGIGQTAYDWPDACDPRRLESVAYQQAGLWISLPQGIGPREDSYVDVRGPPQRYDVFGTQMEIYPQPDAAYSVALEYIRRLDRFTQAADRTTLDGELVYLTALAAASAHYKQPDAQVLQDKAERMFVALNGRQHTGQRYFLNERSATLPKPRVVEYDGSIR